MMQAIFAMLLATLTFLPSASADDVDYDAGLEPAPHAHVIVEDVWGVCIKTDPTATPPTVSVMGCMSP